MRPSIFLLTCGLIVLADGALAAGKLAPKDIQATFFTGEPFTASSPSDSVKYKMVFTPDGKTTREPVGKGGSKGQGSWKLSKEGFCSTWSPGKETCYTVVEAGKGSWSIMNGTSRRASWSK
jgi:hypothetical protein